jgi:DNA (cytosine-5)-methyltransferase 1
MFSKRNGDKMIKLATVFSGIGAIEHALDRLGWNHEVVFACDNGNIEIDIDPVEELNQIRKLENIDAKKEYVRSLYKNSSRKTNFVEKSYLANYKVKDDNFFYDIRLLDGNDFRNKVDLLVGGSPCQSFSMIGAKAGLEDTRGTLFYDFARLVQEVEPNVFIYENVYGLLKHDKGNTWQVIHAVFKKLGYYFDYSVLDSRDFNIPQGRRRIFVVGFKIENAFKRFQFPKPIKLNFKMSDFLLDNCAFGDFVSNKGILNIRKSKGIINEKLFLSEKLKEYVLSPGTKNFYHPNIKFDLDIARAILSTQGNSHRASVNNYVTTDSKIRALDPRESLRLMGFTDDFKITVSKSQSYIQSGNSIVVDVLIYILREINKAAKWNE